MLLDAVKEEQNQARARGAHVGGGGKLYLFNWQADLILTGKVAELLEVVS